MNTKTKICCSCKRRREIELFNFKNKSAGIRHRYCRDCGKEFTKSHYERNREYYKDKAKRSTARARRASRQQIVEYLTSHPCIDCGEQDVLVLQFDHVRGQKLQPISELVKAGYSWEAIETEIAKCEVRCANCHTRRTAKQRRYHAYLES